MDPETFRSKIPVLRNNPEITYLDSATTTLVPDFVIKAMKYYYENIGTTPNFGMNDLVVKANKTLQNAREVIGKFFNVSLGRIAFINSTSHGSATAASISGIKKQDRVLLASNLHNSSFLNWFRISKEKNADIQYISLTNSGQISLIDLKEKLNRKCNGKTFVVLDHSPMGIGSLLPIEKVSDLVHDFRNTYLYLDATRTAGSIDIDIKRLNIDFLVCQGNTTLYAPHGTGVLIYPNDLSGDPVYIGSGSVTKSQKHGYELNSFPTAIESDSISIGGIIGLRTGIEFILDVGKENIQKHYFSLMKSLYKGLNSYDGVDIRSNMDLEINSGILGFTAQNFNPHDIAFYLNEISKIYVRSGEQCNHLLMNELGLKEKYGIIQVSLSYYNIKSDIERFVDKLGEIICL